MPIETVEDLREHLELAITVELSTIPPYLYAMYSLADAGSSAALLLRSIVAEEMLHAALCANILLAVGGSPRFAEDVHLSRYPCALPHHDPPLHLSLQPCSERLLREVFARIEQPETHGAPPEADSYETLGQFYHAVERGLVALAADGDLFATPQAERQLADPSFYTAVTDDDNDSGGLLLVDDIGSACQGIEVIVHQGEGLSESRWADSSHRELTHYFKLLSILDRTNPLGEVLPVPTDPRTADYPPNLRPVSHLFNAAYRFVVLLLDELYSPRADKAPLVDELYRVMTRVMGPLARWLVAQPYGAGVAAPTFEVVDVPAPAREHLVELSSDVVQAHPDLRGVHEALMAGVAGAQRARSTLDSSHTGSGVS
jgi:hypothetical protein